MLDTMPEVRTYGITERKPAPLVDMMISYELGDLTAEQEAEMFKMLEAKGEKKLIKKLRKGQQ